MRCGAIYSIFSAFPEAFGPITFLPLSHMFVSYYTMLSQKNSAWFLSNNPDVMPVLSDFELRQTTVPKLGQGDVLLAIRYLSLDPYM